MRYQDWVEASESSGSRAVTRLRGEIEVAKERKEKKNFEHRIVKFA